jgi:energy-converting hydrogenase Eha subunit H
MGYYYKHVEPEPEPEPWNWSVIIKLVIALLVLIFTLVESVQVLQCVANVLMICLVAGFPVFALKCMVGDL